MRWSQFLLSLQLSKLQIRSPHPPSHLHLIHTLSHTFLSQRRHSNTNPALDRVLCGHIVLVRLRLIYDLCLFSNVACWTTSKSCFNLTRDLYESNTHLFVQPDNCNHTKGSQRWLSTWRINPDFSQCSLVTMLKCLTFKRLSYVLPWTNTVRSLYQRTL